MFIVNPVAYNLFFFIFKWFIYLWNCLKQLTSIVIYLKIHEIPLLLREMFRMDFWHSAWKDIKIYWNRCTFIITCTYIT